MDTIAPELLTMVPKTRFSRRGFVATSLAGGFALSVQPVSAETIATDSKGLVAGEVKVPTADGDMPAYRAPHGFNADYRPSYRPDDAKDAWKRMLDWSKKYGVA